MAKSLLAAAEANSGRSYAAWHKPLKPAALRALIADANAIMSGRSHASLAGLARQIIKRYGLRVKYGTIVDWLSANSR
jgi:hypothetical protein